MMHQVDAADVSRTRKLELQDKLREHTSTVLQALEAVLAPAGPERGSGPGSPAAGGGAEGGGDSGNIGAGMVMAPKQVVLVALDCLKEWAQLGVSLGRLATDRPRLMDRLVRLLAGEAGGPDGSVLRGQAAAAQALPTACAACNVIMELLAVQEYPRPAARVAAAEAILRAMGEMPSLFAAAIQVRRDL